MDKPYSDHINEMCHYATQSELNWLREHAKTLPSRSSVVMIGAGPAVMALAVLEGNPDLGLSIVDKDTCQYAQAHIKDLVRRMDRGLDVLYFEMDSIDFAKRQSNNPVHFLIIDGDHSYLGVKRDLAAWLPKCKIGTHVFLHDYNADETEFKDMERYLGVRQAVNEYSFDENSPVKWSPVCTVGTAIVMRIG